MFETGWKAHPSPRVRKDRAAGGIPTYAVQADSVGAAAAALALNADFAAIQINPKSWATAPGGVPVIRARTGGREFWVERAMVIDPAYDETARIIDALADRMETKSRETLWDEKRAQYTQLKEITLVRGIIGYAKKGQERVATKVAAGTYRLEYVTNAAELPGATTAPFLLLLNVSHAEVYVDPLNLEAGVVDDTHVEEAKRRNLDVTTTSDQVLADLRAVDEFWQLAHGDERSANRVLELNYVSPEQMCAVGVLERMPKGDAEISGAKEADPYTFAAGARSDGVRFSNAIFVQHSARGTGTEHHETVHWLSAPALLAVLGFHANEGVTEHFTRMVTIPLGKKGRFVRNDDQYGTQRECIGNLVDLKIMTDQHLADAYFGGNIYTVFSEFARWAPLERMSFQAYCERLDGRRGAAAGLVLHAVWNNEKAAGPDEQLTIDISTIVSTGSSDEIDNLVLDASALTFGDAGADSDSDN